MKIHEDFYGQALQEINQGTKRDEIWGKAFALSAGDIQKAKAIYIDLLAHYFSRISRADKNKKAISVGKYHALRFSRFLIWLVLLIMLIATFTTISISIHENYTLDQANNYQPAGLIQQDYYRAIVAAETGTGLNDLSEKMKDVATLRTVDIYSKYDSAAAEDIFNYRQNARRTYSDNIKNAPSYISAIKSNPSTWFLLVLIFSLLISCMTFLVFKYLFNDRLLKTSR